MSKNVVKNKTNNLISIVLLTTLLFLSCKKNETTFVVKNDSECKILYYSDSIIFKDRYEPDGIVIYSKFIKYKGDYYTKYDSDKKMYLFLSVNKDTVYRSADCLFKRETNIKKINNNLYSTSVYFVYDHGSKIWFSTIYYDKNYKILKTQNTGTIEYVPR